MKNFVKEREEYFIALILTVVSVITGVILFSFDNLSFVYFGDAVSHIVRARQFIDSQQPGLNNIGTVWLPLPHLLLLPVVAFDTLFYSGIAGAFIGIPFLIGTGILLFSIIVILTHSRPIAFFFALLFGLNPNLIYIALTPMNEISLLFFVTLSGFGLLKWLKTKNEYWMILCSFAVFSATLCRYEAWLLAPFVSVIALSKGIKLWNEGKKSNAVRILFIAKVSWLGILFWFCWNYFQYGDALKFAHWTYSVGTSAVRSTFQDNPQKIFFILCKALLWIFGPMLIGASALMVFSFQKLRDMKEQLVLLFFLSLPAVFVVMAILIGFVQIDQWWWNWRFVLTFGLFLSIASTITMKALFQKVKVGIIRTIILGCFLLVPAVQLSIPNGGVAVFNDASKSFDEHSRSAVLFGEELHKKYQNGTIAMLTGYGVGQRIMISSHLPLKTFSVKYFSSEPIPAITDRYIILGKDRTPESEEFSRYWLENKHTLQLLYSIGLENNDFIFLIRNK